MNRVFEFLTEVGTYYIATVDGDKPRVRPFGAHVLFEGRIYFCTNSKKEVYRQLKANSAFEISGTNKNKEWIRIKADAVFDSRKEAKEAFLEAVPFLNGLYGDGGEHAEVFEVFYADNMNAELASFTGDFQKLV